MTDLVYDIEGVVFAYGDKQVIDDLSLQLKPGRFYGIVGPNGCGKSTLLDLMTRHIRPGQGCIRYNGNSLDAYSKTTLAKEIALVPQNFYINFQFTAAQIVMMGRYPHIPRFAKPSPADVALVDQIMEQTETTVFQDRWITELSGGERQRVVIARALAQNTPVLVLDEATSNLDVNHSMGLLGLTRHGVEQHGKTVIAVLQDINLAALFCDELIFMKQGSIVAQGPVADILTHETVKRVFQVESKTFFEPYVDSVQVVFKPTDEQIH